MLIDITTIKIGDRFRKEYRNMEELQASLKEYGQLQDIVIDQDNNLCAGGRRLMAAIAIGWKQVEVKQKKDIDEALLREIELEENIQREDLTWVERANLTEEVHRLKQLKHGATIKGSKTAGGWSLVNTADATGQSKPAVIRNIQLAQAIREVPELANEKTQDDALRRLARIEEALERELSVRRMPRLAEGAWHGDALLLIKKVPNGVVDCIIMDPPYGTDTESAMAEAEVHFDDSDEAALDFFIKIVPELKRVAKPNAHLYCFSGIKANLTWRFMEILHKAGFDVDEIPLIWKKDTYGRVDFSLRYAPQWEPIIFCLSRDRTLPGRRGNIFEFPPPPGRVRSNSVEKPPALIAEFLRYSTKPGELVLDPCAGSGPTAVACKQLNRRFIVIEQDQEQWGEINIRLTNIDKQEKEDVEDIG